MKRTFGMGLKLGLLNVGIAGILLLPYLVESATKVLVDTDSTQTLQNKTIDSTNTISGVDFSSPEITGTVTGGATYNSVTLSTATINSGTIPSPTISGTVAGTATYTAPVINGGTIQGTISGGTGLTMPSFTVPTSKMITLADAPSAGTDVANKDYVDAAVVAGGDLDALSDVSLSGEATGQVLRYGGSAWNNFDISSIFLPLAGGTMTGNLTLNGSPSSSLHAATKTYVDTADNLRVTKAGDTMTGALTLSGSPTAALHAATKGYVDGHVSVAVYTDLKAAGTAGGTFTQDAWQQRSLTTEAFDPDSIASLSSSDITLTAGEYLLYAQAVAYKVNTHQVRIWNSTDANVTQYGSVVRSNSGGDDIGISNVWGYLNVSSSKVIQLQHYCTTTNADDGLGLAINNGGAEVYAFFVLVKFT